MAADRLITHHDVRFGHVTKIIKARDGTLVGASGRLAHTQALLEWASSPGFELSMTVSPPDLGAGEKGLDALLAHPVFGLLTWDGTGPLIKVDTPYAAIGTGAEFALGAMGMGANARQAVQIAARFDPFTGEEIDLVHCVDEPSEPWRPEPNPIRNEEKPGPVKPVDDEGDALKDQEAQDRVFKEGGSESREPAFQTRVGYAGPYYIDPLGALVDENGVKQRGF
jgi:hypothetical protein